MRRSILATALIAGLALAGCSDKAKKSTTAPSPTSGTTAATAEVTASWEGFFDGSKPAAERASYLQDAASLAQALALAGKDPNAAATKATVTNVALVDATHATVTYDLVVKGTTVLPGAQGQEVLVNGHWMVSKASFCQLVALKAGGTPVPGCS